VGKVTGAVRQPHATEWLAAYRPLRIPPRDWEAVRPFVVESVTRLGLDHGAASVRVVRVLARLATWAVGEGLALDAEVCPGSGHGGALRRRWARR